MCSKPVAWKGVHCCGYDPYTCMLIKNPMMMIMTPYSVIKFRKYKLGKAKGWVGKERGRG